MTSQQPLRATLDAKLDNRGSIRGSLCEPGGDPVPFTGWLGLVGAINELAERAGGRAAARRLDLLDGGPGESAP